MDRPFFTVVMPVLNAMPYLEQALASVLSQAGDDTEVVVVDGGSTDGSVAVMLRLAAEYSGCGVTLRWVSERDDGQSAALNKGFAMARGDVLLWVNGDDLLLPETLARAREHLERRPACAWLAGNMVYVDENDRVWKCAVGEGWHPWLYKNAPVRVYGPSSFFRRELLARVGGFDESLHYMMDTDMWLRFKAAGAQFERLNHFCWGFRVHEGSKTSGDLQGRTSAAQAAERARVYEKNGLQVTRCGVWKQRGWRMLSGCYGRAVVATLTRRLGNGGSMADEFYR